MENPPLGFWGLGSADGILNYLFRCSTFDHAAVVVDMYVDRIHTETCSRLYVLTFGK